MATIFSIKAEIGEIGIYQKVMKPKIKKERKKKGLSIKGDGNVIIRWATPIPNTNKFKNHQYNITELEGINFSTENLPKIRKLRAEYIEKVNNGIDPTEKYHIMNITVNDAVKMYLDDRYKNQKQHRQYLNAYKRIQNISIESTTFGEKWLKNISIEDYQKVIKHRESQGVKYGTIKRELTIVTSTLNHSVIKKFNPPELIIKDLKYRSKDKGKPTLDERISSNLEEFSQLLYKAIMEEDAEYRLFHLLTFMTARRVGEVQQLKIKDFDIPNKRIHARNSTRKGIKKTEINRDTETETYPINDEISQAFEELIEIKNLSDEDNIFKYKNRPYSDRFIDIITKLIKDEEILVTKLFNRSTNTAFAQHDNRSLLGVIMNKYYSQDYIGKHVLSHYDTSNTDSTYTKPSFEGKLEILNSYWDKVRGTKQEKTHKPTLININETYYENGELKSFKDGNIIEGYYEDTNLLYRVELENDTPINGVWYDENGNENKCTRATYKKFGLI